jgi:hypothetical protein
MENDENRRPEEKTFQDKAEQWIDKAEEFMDDTADKIHESETYRKANKSVENATIKLFRKAGRLWGKSEHYFKNRDTK